VLDRAAVHLLLAAPEADPFVVDVLREAAAAACARGDASTARGFLRRALEEPPQLSLRPELLLELARAETAVGEPEALAHMEEAVASIRDDGRAASVLRDLSRLHCVRSDHATAAMVAQQALARTDENALNRDRLRALGLLSAGLNPPTFPAFLEVIDELIAATRAGSPPSDPELQGDRGLEADRVLRRPGRGGAARGATDGSLTRRRPTGCLRGRVSSAAIERAPMRRSRRAPPWRCRIRPTHSRAASSAWPTAMRPVPCTTSGGRESCSCRSGAWRVPRCSRGAPRRRGQPCTRE
jgi:tetratricopeptide (TPR) repeat protein